MLKNRIEALYSKILDAVGDGEATIVQRISNGGLLRSCSCHGKGCPNLPCEICESCHRSGKSTIVIKIKAKTRAVDSVEEKESC